MRKSRFFPLQKRLVAEFPQLAIRSRQLVMVPVGHILRGVCFDPSAFDRTSFYLTTFVMPLCIPVTYIYYTFGNRISHPYPTKQWETNVPDVHDALSQVFRDTVIPFLTPLPTLRGFIDFVGAPTTQHRWQALAYCLALDGQIEKAIEAFDRLIMEGFDERPWQIEMEERARKLRLLLLRDPSAAQCQLSAWADATAESLKVDRFRAKSPIT